MNSQKNRKKNTKTKQNNGPSNGIGRNVLAPAAQARSVKNLGPKITRKADGSCRIQHRELVGSIVGSTEFVTGTVTVNPGLNSPFPWLSQVAQQFEEYKFNSLKFEYLTRCGTDVAGSMMLIPEYDVTEDAPVSEQIAMTYVGCKEDAPWKNITIDLPAKSLQGSAPRHYVRPQQGLISPDEDPKLYDVALLFTGTVDGNVAGWGKLWVEYDIELFLPQLNPHGPLPYGGNVIATGALTPGNPLGSTASMDPSARGIVVNGISDLYFKVPGDYVMAYSITGTGLLFDNSAFDPLDISALGGTYSTSNAALTVINAYKRFRVLRGNALFSFRMSTSTTITGTNMTISTAPKDSVS